MTFLVEVSPIDPDYPPIELVERLGELGITIAEIVPGKSEFYSGVWCEGPEKLARALHEHYPKAIDLGGLSVLSDEWKGV